MTASPADRLLQLARELSGGSLEPELQRELGRLLHFAASWQSNPLRRLLPKHAANVDSIESGVADTLRILLQERGRNTDGDLLDLALRSLHLSREDRDLMAIRCQIIERLEGGAASGPVRRITPAVWRAGWCAYVDWLRTAYRFGRPTDSQMNVGVDMAVAAMKLAETECG